MASFEEILHGSDICTAGYCDFRGVFVLAVGASWLAGVATMEWVRPSDVRGVRQFRGAMERRRVSDGVGA